MLSINEKTTYRYADMRITLWRQHLDARSASGLGWPIPGLPSAPWISYSTAWRRMCLIAYSHLRRWLGRGISIMRMLIKIISTSVAIAISGSALVQAADLISGSGVVIGANGEVLTNSHVVENCTKVTVRSSSAASAAFLVARDEKNDLAVVRSKLPLSSVVAFREWGTSPRWRCGGGVGLSSFWASSYHRQSLGWQCECSRGAW